MAAAGVIREYCSGLVHFQNLRRLRTMRRQLHQPARTLLTETGALLTAPNSVESSNSQLPVALQGKLDRLAELQKNTGCTHAARETSLFGRPGLCCRYARL